MDKSAFEHEARTWRQKAVSVSRSCGAGDSEAEDIAQDVMLRLWQMRDELEDVGRTGALAAVMARHLTRNRQRRRPLQEQSKAITVALDTDPHELLEVKENEAWLASRLAMLPTTQRTLIYMRQVEHRSHEEIARLLGIEQTSVSTLLARARRTLLEEMKRRNQI